MPFDVKSRLAQARQSDRAKCANPQAATLEPETRLNSQPEIFSTSAPLARGQAPKSEPIANSKILVIGINTYSGNNITSNDDGKMDFQGWGRANGANGAKNSDHPSGGDFDSAEPLNLTFEASEPVAPALAGALEAAIPAAVLPALAASWVDFGGIHRPTLPYALPPIPERPVGVPGDWWDGLVRLMVLPTPSGVPDGVWRGIQTDACHVIVDFGVALGLQDWTELEIFGCHAEWPLARIPDCQGLIISLAGARLKTISDSRKPGDRKAGDIHQQAAEIIGRSGGVAFHRFHPRPVACVPLWGLE